VRYIGVAVRRLLGDRNGAAAATALILVLCAASISSIGPIISRGVRREAFGFALRLPAPPRSPKTAEVWMTSLSCPRAGDCVAAGLYSSNRNATIGAPVVATEVSGKWEEGLKPLMPSNAAEDQTAQFDSISCSTLGDCVAVGTYAANSMIRTLVPFAVTEDRGKWSRGAAIPLPANFDARGGVSVVSSVSCVGINVCAVVGQYPVSGGGARAFIDSEVSGSWSTSEAPMPSNAQSFDGGLSSLQAIVCREPGYCDAAGWYLDSRTDRSPLVLSEIAGNWSQKVAVDIPSNGESQGQDNGLDAISCPTPSTCVVGGTYDTKMGTEGFFDQEANEVWTAPVEAKLPTSASSRQVDTTPQQFIGIHALSCSTPTTCVAGGSFSSSGDTQADSYSAVTYMLSGSTWQIGLVPGLPLGAVGSSRQYSNVDGADCTSSGCTIAGTYADGYSYGSFSATPASLPSAPQIRRVISAVGGFTICVKATATTGGLPLITYQYSLSAGTAWKNPRSGSSTCVVLTKLLAHHRYSLSVRAVTEEGFGPRSAIVVATTKSVSRNKVGKRQVRENV
jgi:hypothetical protein